MKKLLLTFIACTALVNASEKSAPTTVSRKDRLHNCVTYTALLGSVELIRRIALAQIMYGSLSSSTRHQTSFFTNSKKRTKIALRGISLLLHRSNKNELNALLLENNRQSTIVSVEGIPVLTVPDVVEMSYDFMHNDLRKYQEKWDKQERKLPVPQVLLKAYVKSKLQSALSAIAPHCYNQLPQSIKTNEWVIRNKELLDSYGPLLAQVITDAAVEGVWQFYRLFGPTLSYKPAA